MGPTELIVILVIVVVLFGATKIPQLGRGLGEGIRNFRQGLKGGDEGGGSEIIPPGRQLPGDSDKRAG